MQNDPGQIKYIPNQALRCWPALFALGVMWFIALIGKPIGGFVAFMAILVAPSLTLLVLLAWWFGFSRSERKERWLIGILMVSGIVFSNFLIHPLLRGLPFVIQVLPWILTAWAGTAFIVRKMPSSSRVWVVGSILVLSFAIPTALRFDGMAGDMGGRFSFRWTPTSEDRFLNQLKASPTSISKSTPPNLSQNLLGAQENENWSQFRGPNRDSRINDAQLTDDWRKDSPTLLWKQLIGPGWSSIAVVGNSLFTQEQRGESEVISCYGVDDGSPKWIHEDAVRFEEALAGAGPRATPTVVGTRLYALGASGVINCLNADNGERIWTRNLISDTGATLPIWGFSSSPLVIDDKVILIACGPNKKGVIAYDAATGEPSWTAGEGTHCYTSAEAFTYGGFTQVLSTTDYGLQSFDVRDGSLLWEHVWKSSGGARMLQPLLIDGNHILVQSYLDGTRLIDVAYEGGKWSTSVIWATRGMKSYFNDCVVHDGYLYGFDDKIFACVDLKTGKQAWKKGRYGHGQVALLAGINRLLVLGEEGQCVLLNTNATAHEEFGQFQAIQGKTWNHPVVLRGKLLVRNGEEMACYSLRKEH